MNTRLPTIPEQDVAFVHVNAKQDFSHYKFNIPVFTRERIFKYQ